MKISLAQIKPVPGDMPINISNHLRFVHKAAEHNADLIVFPELSLTGYEPSLAKILATSGDDPNLRVFQEQSDAHNLVIAVGVPMCSKNGVLISLVIFQPQKRITLYSKRYLHESELPYFIEDEDEDYSFLEKHNISFAICYELSIDAHLENALNNGAKTYLASVAKTSSDVANAHKRLKWIAQNHQINTMMCNCVGPCHGEDCSGHSAVWNLKGELVDQLDGSSEGLLTWDGKTQKVLKTLI